MLHDVKKSFGLKVLIALMPMLQLLCLLTPIIVSFCQFWFDLSKTVVRASVRIKKVLNQQHEVILLLFLLRLLYLTLCTHFWYLSLLGAVPLLIIFHIHHGLFNPCPVLSRIFLLRGL